MSEDRSRTPSISTTGGERTKTRSRLAVALYCVLISLVLGLILFLVYVGAVYILPKVGF